MTLRLIHGIVLAFLEFGGAPGGSGELPIRFYCSGRRLWWWGRFGETRLRAGEIWASEVLRRRSEGRMLMDLGHLKFYFVSHFIFRSLINLASQSCWRGMFLELDSILRRESGWARGQAGVIPVYVFGFKGQCIASIYSGIWASRLCSLRIERGETKLLGKTYPETAGHSGTGTACYHVSLDSVMYLEKFFLLLAVYDEATL